MKIAFILVFALVVFLGCLVSNNKIAVCSSLDIGQRDLHPQLGVGRRDCTKAASGGFSAVGRRLSNQPLG